MKTKLSLGLFEYGGYKNCPVSLDLKIKPLGRAARTVNLEPASADEPTLSICGNVWLPSKRDILTGGQCVDTIRELLPAFPHVQRICDIWEGWHLNDMRAGTVRQIELLKAMPLPYEYTKACEFLKECNAFDDRGYKYGYEWLIEPIPTDILSEIKTLFGVSDDTKKGEAL